MQLGDTPLSRDEYLTKAKKYRKIGWWGGAAIAVAGIAGGICAVSCCDWGYDNYLLWAIGTPMVCVGGAWCLAWNLAANNQMKKAEMAMAYSVPMMEWDLLNSGSESLSASVNVMGDNMMQRRNYGLGLGLNFRF